MSEYNNNAFNAMENATKAKSDNLFDTAGEMNNTSWEDRLEDRGISLKEFKSLYKERWGTLDRESYGQIKSLYDPENYRYLESENFPPQILEAAMMDAEMYMNEMRSGKDPEQMRYGSLSDLESRKIKGLKGFLQRLLPGGETGYEDREDDMKYKIIGINRPRIEDDEILGPVEIPSNPPLFPHYGAEDRNVIENLITDSIYGPGASIERYGKTVGKKAARKGEY